MATKTAKKGGAGVSSKDVGSIIAQRARANELSSTDVRNIQKFVASVEKTLSQFRTSTMQGW